MSQFATRTLAPRVSDGWPFGRLYLRSTLLSFAGVALFAVNAVVLRAAWALGGGEATWAEHLTELRSVPALALHTALCAIACGFALGVLGVTARITAPEQRRWVLAAGLVALGGVAALGLALCAGVLQ